MITVRPVLEICAPEGFDLWPVAAAEPYTFLPLGGELTQDEIGTAVMALASCNDLDPDDDRPPRPADPLGGFLHGLLTMDPLFASGGLRVTDTATGAVLVPGCCSGLEDRGDWWEVLDGDGWAGFGHNPSPVAERYGETVRLTVDSDAEASPVIEVSVPELRRLLTQAEHEVAAFLHQAALWTARQLPDRSEQVSRAIKRALTLPTPGTSGP
ncbi:hypothetical protein [Streptomyces sp. NPDC050759]|uniref:hypothetical protein n=1 Tax=Streptomyces sp. NPDC050759 TaxID=3365635 RepID=UPI003788C058